MHFYLSLICALIDAVASQLKTTGSFYKAVGPSKGIEVDSGSLLLDEAFFKCDGSDSCKTVFKAKESDKLKSADYKLEEAQRRVDATLDFNRTITDYKKGFGDLNGNFWLGLDQLHSLAPRGSKTTLRIKIKHSSRDTFFDAYYQDFSITGEDDKYRLAIGAYHGNAGDSLRFHNGQAFSTYKKTEFGELIGGWWDFGSANLNALYPAKGYSSRFMTWYDLVDDFGGITYSEMMLTQD
ncbi:ficolin-1-like [Rhopilema esculentum]|uniref:ficolin-1-like n=1 Tax=Rhopilema esculentum TaxID=499914 RepID=UPI0031DF721D|eukprot:gene195-9824_t